MRDLISFHDLRSLDSELHAQLSWLATIGDDDIISSLDIDFTVLHTIVGSTSIDGDESTVSSKSNITLPLLGT